jgi:dGTPase
MRHRLSLQSAEQLARLDERLPKEPLAADGSPGPGLESKDDGRGRYRSPAQRDRDRILYSAAFQRLGGVTQVTESESGYTFHTRLTHSLKVAQVARRLSEKLLEDKEAGAVAGRAAEALASVEPDAVEAAALAHDLGHPPFGHVAEEWLRDNTAASFEGNAQSFRILTELAIRDLDQTGLSLTRRTLDGSLKYPYRRRGQEKKWGAYEEDAPAFCWVRRDSYADDPSLTARIMDWADDVTYAVHDLEDFYRAGLIPLHLLRPPRRSAAAAGDPVKRHQEVERFREGLRAAGKQNPDDLIAALDDVLVWAGIEEPYEGRRDQRAEVRTWASTAITQYLAAVTLEEGTSEGHALISIDEDKYRQVEALKSLTWVYVVRRPALAVMQTGRVEIIKRLYEVYAAAAKAKDERMFPAAYRDRLTTAESSDEQSRLVVDLISGLTEEAALGLFRRLSGIDPGSVIDAVARPR